LTLGRRAAAVVLFGFLLGALVAGSTGCTVGCEFDEDAWRSRGEEVVEDLVECNHLLYGKSPEEVREMLGEPDKVTRRPLTWDYWLPVPGPLSDYPPLEIVFDGNRQVEEVSVSGYVER
jgi:hypothetical protein